MLTQEEDRDSVTDEILQYTAILSLHTPAAQTG